MFDGIHVFDLSFGLGGDQRALDGNLDLLLGKLFEIHTLIGLGQFQGVNNIPGLDVPAGIEDPQQVIKQVTGLVDLGALAADP